MHERPLDPGARHRSAIRAVFGPPGSLRRWLISTAVWLLLCYIVFLRVEYLMRIVVVIFAMIIPFATWNARKLVVGDEDELRAHVRKTRFEPPPLDDPNERPLPSEAWLSHGSRYMDDAPPPPVADDDLGGLSDASTDQTEPPVPLG